MTPKEALERIEEQHVVVFVKRHSMLPKGAAPDISRMCSVCSNESHPCEKLKLARALDKAAVDLRLLAGVQRNDARRQAVHRFADQAQRTLEEVAG